MLHKHGGDIYSYKDIRDFSANINFLGMPERVYQAAVDSIRDSIHYPDPDYRKLKEALSSREHVSAKSIICGNGAAELMFSLMAAVKPKHALVAVPSFFEYEQALASADCEIRYYALQEREEFQAENRILDLLTEDLDVVILGNPNNPTGQIIKGELLKRILEHCSDKHILLVLDESFYDFLSEYAADQTFSGTDVSENYKNLFVLKSFTKMYGMPGLRFGYGICTDESLLRSMREKLQPWNVSVPACQAAIAAAGETEYAKQTAQMVSVNRTAMMEQLERSGYQVYGSEANFLLFKASEGLADYCIDHGYLIRDCSNFPGLPSENGKKYFRICVRSKEENQELLQVLSSFQDQ